MTDAPELAAQILSEHWLAREAIGALPDSCRPATRAEGYAVQALWPARIGPIGGWKIAATSVAGQRHIGVDGPLAGPVFARRVWADGATVSLTGNRMRVAECEVVFGFDRAIEPRRQPWTRAQALAEVARVMPGIEVPDSRFLHFERAGQAQLIADCACCHEMLLGRPAAALDRLDDLAALSVQARLSDGRGFEALVEDIAVEARACAVTGGRGPSLAYDKVALPLLQQHVQPRHLQGRLCCIHWRRIGCCVCRRVGPARRGGLALGVR